MKAAALLFTLLLSFTTLGNEGANCVFEAPASTFFPKYARHFKIKYFKNFKVIEVGQDSYLLSSKKINCRHNMQSEVKTPVARVAFMSTTYLPALEILNKQDTLVAFQGKQYIVSKAFNKTGLKDLSYKFNPEDLLKLKADLIMGYSSNLSDPKQKETLKRLSLPVVINKDFEEKSPLARAEWLIFISAFYNLEEKAHAVFREIEFQYNKTKEENQKLPRKTVLVGSIENGFWITSGGKSDLAQLIQDAGGEMAFANDSSETQRLSLEFVLKEKRTFDVWLTHNSWQSEKEKAEVFSRDQRYRYIKAERVYNNNLIRNESGATDFWETAVQRPDYLLQDLSSILHPEHYKKSSLKWYRRI